LYLAWRDRLFTLVTSDEQLEEFRRVTRYPRIRARIEPSAAGTLHNELQNLPPVDVSPDPWDNYLLSMVQVGKADFLVTADKRDVLSLKGNPDRHHLADARGARPTLTVPRDHRPSRFGALSARRSFHAITEVSSGLKEDPQGKCRSVALERTDHANLASQHPDWPYSPEGAGKTPGCRVAPEVALVASAAMSMTWCAPADAGEIGWSGYSGTWVRIPPSPPVFSFSFK
jgi:hypothetical protein